MKSGEGGVNGPEFKDEEHNSPGEVRERKQAGPGTVDPITSERVTGWCFRSPGDTDASYVAVCVDDVLYAPVHSNQLYEGSNAEELPFGGYVGFTFPIPRELHDRPLLVHRGQSHAWAASISGRVFKKQSRQNRQSSGSFHCGSPNWRDVCGSID